MAVLIKANDETIIVAVGDVMLQKVLTVASKASRVKFISGARGADVRNVCGKLGDLSDGREIIGHQNTMRIVGDFEPFNLEATLFKQLNVSFAAIKLSAEGIRHVKDPLFCVSR